MHRLIAGHWKLIVWSFLMAKWVWGLLTCEICFHWLRHNLQNRKSVGDWDHKSIWMPTIRLCFWSHIISIRFKHSITVAIVDYECDRMSFIVSTFVWLKCIRNEWINWVMVKRDFHTISRRKFRFTKGIRSTFDNESRVFRDFSYLTRW